MLTDILIILFLTLLNGFFSMSEIALVTVRKTRMAELAKAGNSRAKRVVRLQQDPEILFATIQIGISVITIAASAFAGANLTEKLVLFVEKINLPLLSDNAHGLSFVIVVALVAYVNITIGELIPKSLGLRFAEQVALFASYPIYFLSRASVWLIKLLNVTSNIVLRIFKDSTSFIESRISQEEIRSLISEGHNAGTVDAHEYRIIENVFDFSDLSVDKIMIPRTEVFALDIESSPKEVFSKAIESGYSRIPVFKGSFSNMVGILYTKKLLQYFNRNSEDLQLEEFLMKTYFVPSTMKISEVLQRMQKRKVHLALVTDEHGEVEGLVTLEDILEEIVGDISDETDEPNKNIHESNGVFLVLGNTPIVDFNKFFNTAVPEDAGFNTISGFILDNLKRFPKKGEEIKYENILFTVKDSTSRTVKSVEVKVSPFS